MQTRMRKIWFDFLPFSTYTIFQKLRFCYSKVAHVDRSPYFKNHPDITRVSLLSIETATVAIPPSMPLSPTQLVLDAPQLESQLGPFHFTRLTIWKRGAPRWGVGPVVWFDHDPHVHRFSIGTQYFSGFDDRPVTPWLVTREFWSWGFFPFLPIKKNWEAVCCIKVAIWPLYVDEYW